MRCAVNLVVWSKMILQTLLAIHHLMNEYPTCNPYTYENDREKFLVLSLWTGQKIAGYKDTLWGWLSHGGKTLIIYMLMQSSTDMLDIQETFFFKTISKHTNYLRIQVLFFHTIYIYIYHWSTSFTDGILISSCLKLNTVDNGNFNSMVFTPIRWRSCTPIGWSFHELEESHSSLIPRQHKLQIQSSRIYKQKVISLTAHSLHSLYKDKTATQSHS